MSTIYTLNGKVLKNSVNDKWLIKSVPPAPSDEVQIGNQIWKTSYLAIDDGQGGVKNCYGGDLKFYTYAAATRICTANYPGWHVAVETDYNVLFSNTLDNTDTSTFNDLFGTEYGGTDKFGLNLRPMYLYLYNNNEEVGTEGYTELYFGYYPYTGCLFSSRGMNAAKCYGLSFQRSEFIMGEFSKTSWGNNYGTWTDVYTIIRLVKDAT